jgi:hypothetical protein
MLIGAGVDRRAEVVHSDADAWTAFRPTSVESASARIVAFGAWRARLVDASRPKSSGCNRVRDPCRAALQSMHALPRRVTLPTSIGTPLEAWPR